MQSRKWDDKSNKKTRLNPSVLTSKANYHHVSHPARTVSFGCAVGRGAAWRVKVDLRRFDRLTLDNRLVERTRRNLTNLEVGLGLVAAHCSPRYYIQNNIGANQVEHFFGSKFTSSH